MWRLTERYQQPKSSWTIRTSCYTTLEEQQNNSRRTRDRQTWKTFFREKGLWTKMVGNIMSIIRQTRTYVYMLPYVWC